jgi:hypothetical protein
VKANSHALVILGIFAGLTASGQESKPLWLDQPVKRWNKAGASIPHAPRDPSRLDEIPPICKTAPKAPKTAEERAIAAAGWMIFGSFDSAERSNVNRGRDRIVVVGAMANMDGMCRPDLYQNFVFVDGAYAGTLSPGLMNARSDGSSVRINFPAPGQITADFTRYTEKDPLCCPSRISEAVFEVKRERGKPVIAAVAVNTHPSDR